jgi:hypothetical protein
MPDDTKQLYSAIFELSGKLDKSLIGAARDAKTLFKQLDQASGATDKASQKSLDGLRKLSGESRSSLGAARQFGQHWSDAAGKIKNAFEPLHQQLEPVHKLLHGLGEVTGIGAAIGAVGGAFATADVLKEGWSTHAEREQSRMLLDTVLQNKQLGSQVGAFNDMLLRFSSDEAKIDYSTAFESAQMALNSGKFSGVADVHKFLSEFADLGGTPEQSKLGMMAMSKMFSEGRIEGRHLNELAADLPQVAWYSEIAKLKNESVAQFRKQMSQRGATIDSNVLLQILDKVTGPGGALFGHAKAQMEGPAGEQWRLLARWKIILDKVGEIEDKVTTPLISRILGDVDVDKLSHFFDNAVTTSEALGKNIGDTYDLLSRTGRFSETGKIISEIGSDIATAFGIKGTRSFADTVAAGWDKLNNTLEWVHDHFTLIAAAIRDAVLAWVGLKVVEISAATITSIRTLAGAVIDLKNAFLGLAGAEEAAAGGEAAVGAGATGAGAGLLAALGPVAAMAATAVGSVKLLLATTSKDPVLNKRADIASQRADLTNKLSADEQEASSRFSATNQSDADIKAYKQQLADLKSKYDEQIKALDESEKATKDASSGLDKVRDSALTAAQSLDAIRNQLYAIQIPHAPASQGDRPHALGGIFTRRHRAIIGESGPEAVLPLSNRVRTADILARAGFGGSVGHAITLNVNVSGAGLDENKLARRIRLEIEDAMPQILRRTDDRMSAAAFA